MDRGVLNAPTSTPPIAASAALERTLPQSDADRPLSPGEITALADALGGLVGVLGRARPEDRAAVYRELNLRLTYDPSQRQVRACVDFARVGRGVGGGT